jgi:serine kinase of HPr protein (carbohydrate metabolism regulator)
MKVTEIVDELKANVIAGKQLLNKEIEYAFASDLMSDVLTLDKSGILLITGLSNLQALRTAEMSDITVVILARNKKASPEMKALAEENGTILLESEYSVFRISGELYQSGIKPIY